MHVPDAESAPMDLPRLLDGIRRGDAGAADRLCGALREPLRREVARMLGDDAGDVDDVVQESLVAALGYLNRDRAFRGDFPRLAITIARNRCRDLLRHRARFRTTDIVPLADWIADPGASPLDHLERSERRGRLQQALDALGRECRKLLHAMYIDREPTESIRRRLGLGTVQAVYYRRSVCLQRVKTILQSRLGDRSGSGTDVTGHAEDMDL